MPAAAKKKKKSARPKPAKATVKKKVSKKKRTPKKAAKKKPLKKKAAKKTVKKKTAVRNPKPLRKSAPQKTFVIEPGPPSGPIPPVEEPARHEEAIGTITHYFSHLGVAIVQINTGALRRGDTVHVNGHVTDFTQTVDSMEYEHRHIDLAEAGQSIGLLVKDHAREHDIVYLVK